MKLNEILELKGRIILQTGLHIGSGNTEIHIGGTDNPVIKHPHTLHPYIPGSSIKGKVRSLLELESGLMKYTKGEVVSLKDLGQATEEEKKLALKILKIFGTSAAESGEEIGPTRVSFSDCFLNEKWLEKSLTLTEVKAENSINRITSTAKNPRFTERVPSGAEFNFHITLKIFDSDNKDELVEYLLKGLKMLENDYLGGNGSRGYGRIKFEFDDKEIQKKFNEIEIFKTDDGGEN